MVVSKMNVHTIIKGLWKSDNNEFTLESLVNFNSFYLKNKMEVYEKEVTKERDTFRFKY